MPRLKRTERVVDLFDELEPGAPVDLCQECYEDEFKGLETIPHPAYDGTQECAWCYCFLNASDD